MTRLVLEKMVHGGRALARLADGRVALVRGGIPGETVEAELREVSGVLQGSVANVLEPSPDRVPAPEHPGLDYGFVAYARQLELKREVAEDALGRAVREARALPRVRPAPSPWRYRSAVQPAVAADGALGYRAEGSHDVVPLARDPVANAAVQRVWEAWGGLEPPAGIVEIAVRGVDPLGTSGGGGDGSEGALVALVSERPARDLLDFGHRLVEAGAAGVHHAPWDPRGRFRQGRERLAGARTLRQRYGRVELTVTVGSFAQPNPAAASELYRALEELAPGGGRALDLYAGGGAVGMHLASGYDEVTCVEIDRGGVARGRADAERHGLGNVRFARGDARRAVIPAGTDLVAVDPPRAGLAKELRAAVADSGVPALLYVSCDVATWARDVADFERRGFRLEHAQPWDFYPHTHHVEMLSLLVR